MKTLHSIASMVLVLLSATPAHSQYTKPVYVSMPSAGNLQHLPLAAAKFKGFYNEMGITNAQLVFLRGNSINVQALVAGSVQFASAFGPSMHAMFRGEQIRILVPIFNQIPFSLVTRPEIKQLQDLKGSKIAVTFGGFHLQRSDCLTDQIWDRAEFRGVPQSTRRSSEDCGTDSRKSLGRSHGPAGRPATSQRGIQKAGLCR